MADSFGKFKKRKPKDVLLYRKGPSSIRDEEQMTGSKNIVLDAPLGLDEMISYEPGKVDTITDLAGSEVLLVYFAKLGNSHEEELHVDLDYLETLIKSGANINFTDSHGQTILHEVALRWSLEVAEYLLKRGAHLNQGDNYGKTALHVAASVNYPEMVRWLVENGADIHARTHKENQSAMHYAAKYNAVDALTMLIELEGRLDDRDHKERTPLQLAAEFGRENACRVLLYNGAPAGVYDDVGTSCLSHMVEKMPDVAAEALEQFQKIDKASRTVYYYLSYLETMKWNMNKEKRNQGRRMAWIREPLEAIIKHNESRLIMHPVIQRLLAKKSDLYGRREFIINLLINFLFTAIWTALTVTLPPPSEVERAMDTKTKVRFYEPIKEYWWRIMLECVGLLMAVYFAIKIRIEFGMLKSNFENFKTSRTQEIKRDLVYCHPRWPQERKAVDEELKNVNAEALASLYDVWFIMDVLSFLGLIMLAVTRVMVVLLNFSNANYKLTLDVHYHSYPFVLIIIWLRFMHAFRPFITLGPFIAMLGYVASDTLKFGFLFLEFFIPYCCAIWIVFGGPVKGFEEGEYPYEHFNDLMFEVIRMTVVDSFEYNVLYEGDPKKKIVAQLICGTYLAITSITCLNLYIALLSETFSRVFGNATATAYMLQGEALITAEKKMWKSKSRKIQTFIATECSPEAVYEATSTEQNDTNAVRDVLSLMANLKRQVEAIQKTQNELKTKTQYLKTEGVEIITQQDELMQDIDESLKYMTQE